MVDGGWNCEWESGSKRSSFASTLNLLQGVPYYEVATGGSAELTAARCAAEEYLLERRLTFGRSSGEVLGDWVTRFANPFRWFYSVPNALDYFRAASFDDETSPDPRLVEAVDSVRAARRPDGTWLQERRHP